MSVSKPHKRPVTREGIALLIEDCEKTSAALSMRPTPFQLEQTVNFLVSTVPAALRSLEEQYEGLRSSIRFCPNCAHGYEWQESDPVEGLCPGCRRAFRIEEQLEASQKALRDILALDPRLTHDGYERDDLCRYEDEVYAIAEAASSPAKRPT